ncbi:MAG: hypothetical protein AAF533_23745 [Acidobacteriota bacterium]
MAAKKKAAKKKAAKKKAAKKKAAKKKTAKKKTAKKKTAKKKTAKKKTAKKKTAKKKTAKKKTARRARARELTLRQLLAAVHERYEELIDHPDDSKLGLYLDSRFAEAIAVGRLLLCFPVSVRRNYEVLALLAEVSADVADGADDVDCYDHARAFKYLQEHSVDAGFTLIVFPVVACQKLWKSKSYIGYVEARNSERERRESLGPDQVLWAGDWAVELLVEAAKEQTNAVFGEAGQRFFETEGLSGLVVSAAADGAVELRAYRDGARDRQRERELVVAELADAARTLDPVQVLERLGHGDLIEPAEPL